MKQLIYLSILVLLFSCGEDDVDTNNQTCIDAEYKVEFNIQLNEEICFPDGNSLIFKNTEHHLCPCGVVCDAEGDLLIVLEIRHELEESNPIEFYTREYESKKDIFINHEISSFSYAYGSEDEAVPDCAADYNKEKMKLTFVISEK